MITFSFLLTSILLGIGLAMDAFTVSLANGLGECGMRRRKMLAVAGVFALFQGVMPMIGWLCVHTIAMYFALFERLVPWIALVLLVYIGGKMLLDGLRGDSGAGENSGVGLASLLIQGVATSIDALSVGFTIAEYGAALAFLCAAIIAAVTFILCFFGVAIGRKAGMRLAGGATVFGGILLIGIGIRIFVSGAL